jgi:hypothetical protein
VTIDLHKPTDPPHASFQLFAPSGDYAVYGTLYSGSGVRRAAVVRLTDGKEVARVEEQLAGVVTRPDGTLEGLVVLEPELMLLEPTGKLRFRDPKQTYIGNLATCVLRDETIVIGAYAPVSAGSSLFAVDRKTGKLLWTGEVDLPPIAHSAYLNKTTVSLFVDTVVLRLDESMIAGLQLFDVKDGKRLLSVTQRR